MGDLLARIQTINLDDGLFPDRPDYGNQGAQKNVLLWVNYFEMAFRSPKMVLYVYNMAFEAFPPKGSPPPEKEITVPDGKKLMQVVRCALETSTFNEIKSDIATDFGNTLISCKKLGTSQMQTGQFKFWAENEVEDGKPNPRKKAIRFRMTLTHSRDLCVSDLLSYLASATRTGEVYESISSIIQALDIIVGHYAKLSLDKVTPKRGKVFPQEPTADEKFKLEGPKSTLGYLQGVRGAFASVRATTDRTLVNCNACCGAFYRPGPLEQLFAMFIPNPNPSLAQLKKLEKAIQGLRVEFDHLKDENGQPIRSIRTIFGLAHPYGGPKEVKFQHAEDNQEYTVAAYWTKKRYPAIRNFGYPVINVGNKDHRTYLPPHVCKIVSGQMAKRKLDPTQISDMIKYARREPEATREFINLYALEVLGLVNNSTLNSFGISLKSDMVTVRSRVLQKPEVIYQNGSPSCMIDQKARWNLRDVSQVFKPGQLRKCAILRIIRNLKDPMGMVFDESKRSFLRTLGRTLGPENVDAQVESWQKNVERGDENALEEDFIYCRDHGIKFLIVVLPDNDASTYKQIKTLGDVRYGINTVCVLGDGQKFYKPNATQYYANVALKINLKLGGTNHILRNLTPLYKSTMVIGIDVTHPSPGATKKTAPSVAAMVASVDDQLAQWPVDLRINTAGKEMVDLLGPMLESRLELWKSKHRELLPDNLLIYRDGVSESQYKAVLEQELAELRDTCKTMYRGRAPPRITLIIVGKRHHTRFFKCTGPKSCTNPEFGTVVDTDVTEARNWDFFLQSHYALIGTARPAHYFVLLNEIFTKKILGPNANISDYLQKLTYDMCYLFGRSTGPVSIPPPVYYADLACERSRCYGDFDDDISDTSSILGDDRGHPQGSPGRAQWPQKGPGYGSPAPIRSGPSTQGPSKPDRSIPGSGKGAPNKQGSGYPAPSKQMRPTEGKTLDLMAAVPRKERGKRFDENPAAQGGSWRAEGKKTETKTEVKPEAKAKGKLPEGKVEGGKPEAKVEKSKTEGKKPETRAEVKRPETRPEAKMPETRAEEKKPEAQAEPRKPKERAKVEINSELRNTMFYI